MTGNNPLVGIFQEMVQIHGDQIAVEGKSKSITYSELDHLSDQMAYGLREKGVKPGDTVGICLPRSLELAAVILAVLKCGAAYMPMDPSAPVSRNRTILERAEARLLVSSDDLGRLPCKTMTADKLTESSISDVTPLPSPYGRACIFHTSGSTGIPKGVEIMEAGILRTCHDPDYIDIRAGDRFACLSNPTFDALTFELFGSLLNGGILVIFTPEDLQTPEALADRLKSARTDIQFITSTLFSLLMELRPDCLSEARIVLVGGEAVSPHAVQHFYQANPESACRIHNGYGPTECTTFSLTHPIDPQAVSDYLAKGNIPIGQPIDRTEIHILDEHLQPVADGETGMLYIGGDGLARGYLNDPERTGDSFPVIPHLGTAPLYRTGDLVRRDQEGFVCYQGRTDEQVKLRGHRIELGEIAHTLLLHPAISQAAALVLEQDGQGQLAVCLVEREDGQLRHAALRQHMAEYLAPSMQPQRYFIREELPRTANGKLDRRELSDSPGRELLATDGNAGTISAAQDPIASIFRDVLGYQPDIKAGFLENGGDSLAAMRIVGRIRAGLGLKGTVGVLMQAPDIQHFIEGLEEDIPVSQPSPLSDHYQASPSQARMLFLQQLSPESDAYNAPFLYEISGEIDPEKLEAAFNQLIQRHPILSCLYQQNGKAITVQPTQGQITLQRVENRASLDAFFQKPFNLCTEPQVRVALLPSGPESALLGLNFHHIAIDGQSLNLLLTELSALYADQDLPPAPEEVDYQRFATIQNSFATSPAAQQQAAQWQERFKGDYSEISLQPLFEKTDRASGSAHHIHHLPVESAKQLEKLAGQLKVTPNSLLMTLFASSLARLTGRAQIPVGFPVANRGLGDFDQTVGMCVNTIPALLDLDPSTPLSTSVQAIHQRISCLYDSQDLDFETLTALAQQAGRGRDLFDVMMVWENTRPDCLSLPGLEVTYHPVATGYAKYPLTLFATSSEQGLELLFDYDMAYLDERLVTNLAEQLACQLESLPKLADSPLHQLPTQPKDQEILQRQWEQGPVTEKTPSFLNQLDHWTKNQPDAIAVISEECQFSYQDLDRRSQALAAHLIREGIGRGDLVGICFGRRAELLVAILGCLKAGAAYVPLDPDYPLDRLAYLSEDSGMKLILAGGRGHEKSLQLGLPVLRYDAFPKDPETSSSELPPTPSGQMPVYVMYTSGSTGNPKGVVISHGGLANYLSHAATDYYETVPTGVVSSSLSFDATITTLLAPLYAGKSVELLPQDGREVEHLARRMEQSDAPAVFKITPSHLWAIRNYLNLDHISTAHLLVVGGEAFPLDLARKYRSLLPNARIINEYGPTETVVGCSSYNLPTDPDSLSGLIDVPIGAPIANSEIQILDSWGGRCPPGQMGEIRIGGRGVAHGYHQRPDLTASRFPRNDEGHVFYTSGDRGYWGQDGLLHYAGRLDEQMKIRGHRIEPGEVETILRRLTGVKKAAIAIQPGENGLDRLLGFLLLQENHPDLTNLLNQAKEQLAPHMMPDRLLPVPSLPFTANGKLDRKALLDLIPDEQSDPPADNTAVANEPSDKLIALLLQEFSDALGYPMDQSLSFFEAGLNSLLIMKIHASLKSQHGLDLELLDFFTHPTIDALADHISQTHPMENDPAADENQDREEPIAIIGMAAHLPGAADLSAFWNQTLAGGDCVSHGPEETGEAKSGDRINAVSSMKNLFDFDPAYFGLSPADADLMDPQQRHMLMGAVHALENAGLTPGNTDGRIGVAVSSSENKYQQALLRAGMEAGDGFAMSLLNEKDFLSSRLAYHLDLQGPAITVQSACSSSLAAVHTACRMLRMGECDMALAGGVSADPGHMDGYAYREGRIYSKDGLCRAFGAHASGTVPANGFGMVVLKPLSKALADGDRIYASIKGSMLNNDGAGKVSFFAPSVAGQADAIARAHQAAGIDPAEIGYVEAHGTGTEIGDPIEVEALTRAFGAEPARQNCALGTVKSQMGHLAAAAGVTGLIRAALGIYHAIIPPTLHAEPANPRIDFSKTPFYLNSLAKHWAGEQRLAAVSSFGMGGTNAHLVLSNVEQKTSQVLPNAYLIPFAAKTKTALLANINQVANRLKAGTHGLAELSAAQQLTKPHYPFRRAIICQTEEEALSQMDRLLVGEPSETASNSMLSDWLEGGSFQADAKRSWLGLDNLDYPFDLTEHNLISDNAVAVSTRSPMENWGHVPVWKPLGGIASQGSQDAWIELPHRFQLTDCRELIWRPHMGEGAEELISILQDLPELTDGTYRNLTILAPASYGLETGKLAGLIQVIDSEYSGLACRLVENSPIAADRNFISGLLTRLGAASGRFRLIGNQLEKLDYMDHLLRADHSWQPEPGLYLVTGGNGGIGSVLVDWLAGHPGCRILSVSRRFGRELSELPALLEGDGKVLTFKTDMTDSDAVSSLASAIKEGPVPLRGIFHLAAQVGGGVIQTMQPASLSDQQRAKLEGIQQIENQLLDLKPDFVTCFSSMSALIGLPGQAAYASANAYLDEWSLQQNRLNPFSRFLSINWPTWRATGMAADVTLEGNLSQNYAIDPQEGLEILKRSLGSGLVNLAVCPMPMDQARELLQKPAVAETDLHNHLADTADPVSAAFTRVLGITSLPEDISFEDLGGDSISALDLLDLLQPLSEENLTLSELQSLGSIQAVRARLEKTGNSSNLLVPMRDGEGDPVLFFHPVGGELTGYRDILQHLPEGTAAMGFRDPLFVDRSVGQRSIRTLAQSYRQESTQQTPALLVGWSFGAMVAWEYARLMVEEGLPLPQLILIDPPVIGQYDDKIFNPATVFQEELARIHPQLAGPPKVNDQQAHNGHLAAIMDACEENARAMRDFSPQQPLPAPARLLIANEGDASPDGYSSRMEWLAANWQPFFTDPLQLTCLEGDHYSIMTGKGAGLLAAEITAARRHKERQS